MKKLLNIFMLVAVVLSGLTLSACSEDDLDTNQYNKDGVNILAFGPMPITRGETMRLTGTKLDKVKEVLFPEGNQKIVPSKTYIQGQLALTSAQEATVTIPDMCVPGKLRLVTQSNDTVVSSSYISFAEEIKVTGLVATEPVHAGDIVSIKGEYVWNIAKVIFSANVVVEAEDFYLNTRNEIQVRVPMEAVSGPVAYNDGVEGSEDVVIADMLQVDVAKVSGLSAAAPEFGDIITINGENLDLVTQVDFPGVPDVEFQTADDGKSITVQVPATCVSGAIILTSASGLTTSVDIAVPLATFVSITPNEELKPGDEVTITGTLLDRIQKLELPGGITLEKGQFSQTATTIKFTVPEDMGDGAVTMVQHENYSVATDKIKMHHEGAEEVIWSGKKTIGSWDGAMDDLSWGKFDWSTVKPGDVLSVYITPDLSNGWSQIRLGNGSWSALPSTKGWGTDGNLELTADDNCVRLTLSQADIDALVSEGGLVICGAYFTVTKVTLPAAETVLWEGELIADDWSNQPFALSDAGAELKDAGAKAGQAVNFYLTPIEPGWKLEILEGHWGPSYGAWCAPGEDTEDGKFQEWDLAANGGKVTIYLTQAMLDAAFTQQWWGGVFVLNGDNVKCTKITLE